MLVHLKLSWLQMGRYHISLKLVRIHVTLNLITLFSCKITVVLLII